MSRVTVFDRPWPSPPRVACVHPNGRSCGGPGTLRHRDWRRGEALLDRIARGDGPTAIDLLDHVTGTVPAEGESDRVISALAVAVRAGWTESHGGRFYLSPAGRKLRHTGKVTR